MIKIKNLKSKSILSFTLLLFLYCFQITCRADELIPIVKLDNPQDTLSSFMNSMNDYSEGIKKSDSEKMNRIHDAIRCLNLKEIPFVLREQKAIESAKLLKEIIDRTIIIDLSKVPNDPSISRWRLKGTEIVISKESEGDSAGEFLFSPQTIAHLKTYYNRIKNKPYLSGTTQGAHYSEPFRDLIFPNWSHKLVIGIEAWKWIAIFLSLLISFTVKVLTEWIFRWTIKLSKFNENSFRYRALVTLEKPIGLLIATLIGFSALNIISLEGTLLSILTFSLEALLGVSLIWASYNISDAFSLTLYKLAQKTETDLDDHLVPLISKSIRVFVIIIGSLMLIQNLGFNVMSLLAGLGLGGLAFALAAKDTASNLFGSIMILMDQPFKMGEWIVVGNLEGNVEEIGFRSTRIRTFYNSLVSVPNSTIANANIDNMGRRPFRRFKTQIGLIYGTSSDQLTQFLYDCRKLLNNSDKVHTENCYVNFINYGSSSLDIQIYCHLKVQSYKDELETKEQLLLEIKKIAENLNVDFAFPTRTIHLPESISGPLQ